MSSTAAPPSHSLEQGPSGAPERTATHPASPAPGGSGRFGGLDDAAARLTGARRRRGLADGGFALLLGATLTAIAVGADGGLQLASKTAVEIAMILGCAGIAALALLRAPRDAARAPLHGGATLAALTALAIVTALSITWSVQPAESWLETNRTLSYVAAFAAALGLVRLAPDRFQAVLHGVAIACVALSAYALATKIFPAWLAPDEQFARLREPFGYWNAVGLMAALGVPPLVWLAARRSGHAAVNALGYPGIALLLTVVLLSFSRGALLALLVGLGTWFALVPLRLRGATALVLGIAGSAVLTAWAFSDRALSRDRVPLDAREAAGLEFGLLCLLVLGMLLAAGLVIGFVTAQSPPSARTRTRAGRGIVGFLVAIPVAGLVALALAPGGIDGQVSQGWRSLTAVQEELPPNTPERLTTTASVRSRYWREAVNIWGDHELRGAGAGAYGTARTRYRLGEVDVRHAHGYVVQTLADLGLIGLLISIAALIAWFTAALRATGLGARRERRLPYGPERIALLTMLSVVVIFGVHSAIDWTWFVPGTAVVAMLCAGWLAGRGPLFGARAVRRSPGAPAGGGPERPSRERTAVALGILAVAIAAAWATWQPLRSVEAGDRAYALLEDGKREEARAAAREGADYNPLSAEPLFEIAAIEDFLGNQQGALQALQEAVALQPANADTWRRLGRYQLQRLNRPQDALPSLRAAYALDSHSFEAVSDYLEVLRILNPSIAPPDLPRIPGVTAPAPVPETGTTAPPPSSPAPAQPGADTGGTRPSPQPPSVSESLEDGR